MDSNLVVQGGATQLAGYPYFLKFRGYSFIPHRLKAQLKGKTFKHLEENVKYLCELLK